MASPETFPVSLWQMLFTIARASCQQEQHKSHLNIVYSIGKIKLIAYDVGERDAIVIEDTLDGGNSESHILGLSVCPIYCEPKLNPSASQTKHLSSE